MTIDASLIEQSNFHAAVADYCHRMTEPAPEGWPIRKFLNQLDRYYACYVLIGLYYDSQHRGGPPPTLSRLQGESQLSPRQTASLVHTLSMAQLIEVENDAGDRRQKILKPLPALIREVGRSCQCFVAAYDRVTGRHLSESLTKSADELGDLISLSMAVIRRSSSVIAAFPRVSAAAGFDCGYPILVGLMSGYYSKGPSGRALTYNAMAERFQVSPSHIANVLAHFRRHDIIGPARHGSVNSDFRAEFEQWCAAEMQHYAQLLRE